MKENQRIFLAQFDQPLRKHIVNFCNIISSKHYDVFILLARKAACFVDTLIELDLIEINGLIVTDRILEYNTDWLKGKTVSIIDDTIISGTSIYKLIRKLENIEISKVDVYAFCINEYWYVEDMLSKEDGSSYLNKPYLKLDHTSSLRFCKQIVDALSLTPRPYNIDFPIYEKIKLTNSKIEKLHNSPYWRIVDTTSSKQLENEIFCYTINPTKKFISKYNEFVSWKISDVAHFKLRLYTKKINDLQNKTTFISKIVPYIIFNPISTNNVAILLETICKAGKIKTNDLLTHLKTDCAKLIFIQFYFAEKLFQTWLDCTNEVFDIGTKFIKNNRSLYFLFSPTLLELIEKIKKDEVPFVKSEEQLFLNENIIFEKEPDLINPINNLFNLTKPFLDFYYEKELPARRIVKRIGKRAFEDINYIDIVNRLDDGISINYLKSKIAKTVNNLSDTNQILSLFLDKYVDNGIIVPITVNKGGFLYRGYRHGEEVIWGNYNNRLLGKYFSKYLSNINSLELPQTYFQKLLVLFLKIGLKEGILEEYSTLTPSKLKIKLLSVKAHLFGQVSDYTELEPDETFETKVYLPIIDSNTKSYWTSKFLQDLEIITINSKKNFEFDFDKFEIPYTDDMEEGEPSDVDQTDLDKVNDLADLFGLLKKDKKIDEDELVLLTSCVNLHDNTASLAAEVQIYLNGIHSYKYKISSNLNSSFTIQRLKELREIKHSYVWTAINSGYYKFLSYTDGKGIDLIHDITTYFEGTGKHFEARTWRRYWKIDIELSKNEANELNLINRQMGNLLLELNISFVTIHLMIFELLLRGKHFQAYFDRISDENETHSKQIITLESKISDVKSGNEFTDQLDTILYETLIKEKHILNKKIRNNKSEIRYWNHYEKSNKQLIEDIANFLLKEDLPFKSILIYNKVVNGYYKQLKSSDVSKIIGDSLSIIDSITEEIRNLLIDYKLTVPEWGKVQQKVRYNSLIHINSNEIDVSKREEISKIIKHYLNEFEIEEFGSEINNKSISLLRISDAKIGEGHIVGIRGQFILERLVKFSCKLIETFNSKNIEVCISAYPYFKENGIEAYFNNQTKNFDIVREKLFPQFENNIHTKQAIIYDNLNKHQLEDFLRVKLKYFKNQFLVEKGNDEISKKKTFIIKTNEKENLNTMTIGVITALPKEFAAVKQILDIEDTTFLKPFDDNNNYISGYINNLRGGEIKVIVALMKEMGTNNASSTVTNMLRSFNEIEEIIVCGIAGGVPDITNPGNHVRLGDIVISDKNGVLQYDNIKEDESTIKIRDSSSKPSAKLLGVVNLLISEYESNNKPWIVLINEYEGRLRNSNRPEEKRDILTIKGISVGHPIDKDRISNESKVHHGPIGSSNTLLKNETKRDFLRDLYGIKAIEMEGSGIADGTWSLSKGYLIVRGIVDYCNEKKNDDWHNYAALCAACYTKSIIQRL